MMDTPHDLRLIINFLKCVTVYKKVKRIIVNVVIFLRRHLFNMDGSVSERVTEKEIRDIWRQNERDSDQKGREME